MSNIGVNLSTGSQPSCFANHAGIWGSSGTDSNSIGHITLGTNSDGNNVFSVRRIFYIYMEMSKSVCVWRGFSVVGVILFVTSDSESLADSPYDRRAAQDSITIMDGRWQCTSTSSVIWYITSQSCMHVTSHHPLCMIWYMTSYSASQWWRWTLSQCQSMSITLT